MAFHDLLGTAGVALIVVMYFLLQSDRIAPENPHFSIWNGVGSILILISLTYEFNFAAALIEGFWLAISIYGLVRARRAVR